MKALINAWKNSVIEEKILWLYAALIPFSSVGYFHLAAKRVGCADLVFAALLVVWLIKYFRGKVKFRRTALEGPFILMTVLFSLSFINSVKIFDSLMELSGLIYLMLLFILIANIVKTREGFRYLLNTFLFTSVVISLAGLVSFGLAMITGDAANNKFLYYGTIESMAHHFPRIQSTLGNPNMLLTYLHAALIAGIILFLLEKRAKKRFLITASIVIILTTAFFTGSRRFTGLLLSLFIILCWFGRGKIPRALKYITFTGFIIFLIASFITTIWVIFPIKAARDADGKIVSVEADYTYSLHFLRPVASISMFKKHPVVGVGLGTYNRHFRENLDWEWVRSSFGFDAYPAAIKSVQDKTLNFDPHSVFLGALAETGLIGFAGLLYLFIAYAVLLAKRFKMTQGRPGLKRIVAGCILAGFIGFLLNGLTLDMLSLRHFWLMMAVGIYPITL